MDRNKGGNLWKENKISFEEFSSTWSCTILLSELVFGGFPEYVITRRHIKTGNYLYILYDENLCSSLMKFFCCANYYMTDYMYDHLANLTEGYENDCCVHESVKRGGI